MDNEFDLPDDFIEAAREAGRRLGPLPESVQLHYIAILAADRKARGDRFDLTLDGLAWRTLYLVPAVLNAMATASRSRGLSDRVVAEAIRNVAYELDRGESNLASAAYELESLIAAIRSRGRDDGFVLELADRFGLSVGRVPGRFTSGNVKLLESARDVTVYGVFYELVVVAWALALGVKDMTLLLVAAGLSQAEAADEAASLEGYGRTSIPMATERIIGPRVAEWEQLAGRPD